MFFMVIPLVFTSASIILTTKTLFRRDSFFEFVFQVLFIVPLLILSFTVGVEFVCCFLSPFFVTAFFLTVVYFLRKWKVNGTFEAMQIYLDDRPRSITFLRAAINMITSCCILACDFKIFPGGLHKTRSYGVGLMDTGIGLFVFSMGIVSKPVRSRKTLKNMLIQVALLLALGSIRTVVIRLIDYHQDEREYGRDLNAFITLGMTKLIGGLLASIFSSGISILLCGLIIAVLHEAILQSGVGDYCTNDKISRISFLEANREGLVSINGFVSLYLISVSIGTIMYKSRYFEFEHFKSTLLRLTILGITAWIFTFVSIYTTGTSRRIANFGYITWVVSLATTTLIISSLLFDVLLKVVHNQDKCLPVIFNIVNYNGLVYFLVSNVLTGFVNIVLSPDKRNTVESICILCIYMTIPCIVNRILYVKRIRIS